MYVGEWRRRRSDEDRKAVLKLLHGISSSPTKTTRWRSIDDSAVIAVLGTSGVDTRTYLQAQLPDASTVRLVIEAKGCLDEVPLQLLVMFLDGRTFSQIAKQIGGSNRKAHDLVFEGWRRFEDLNGPVGK